MGPKLPQSDEERRVELATLEAHDADIFAADPASSHQDEALAVAGSNVHQNYHQLAPSNISARSAVNPPNSHPIPLKLDNTCKPPVDAEQPELAIDNVASSTVTQWAPLADPEARLPGAQVVSPSTMHGTTTTSTPEVLPSLNPKETTPLHNEKSTSSASETMYTAANVQESPARSDLDKEVDLETGNPHSSSSSKTDVEAVEQPLPDPNVVTWDGPDDSQNPMNWSTKLKWGNVLVISTITFLTWVHYCHSFKAHTD